MNSNSMLQFYVEKTQADVIVRNISKDSISFPFNNRR